MRAKKKSRRFVDEARWKCVAQLFWTGDRAPEKPAYSNNTIGGFVESEQQRAVAPPRQDLNPV